MNIFQLVGIKFAQLLMLKCKFDHKGQIRLAYEIAQTLYQRFAV